MCHIFIHFSVDGHLGCFHFLVIVNSARVNTGVHVTFQIMVFFRYMPGAGSQDNKVSLFFVSQGTSILLSIVAVSIYISTNSARVSPFSTSTPAFIVCRHLDDDHSDQCEVISHCSFHLHVSNNEWCWASFLVFVSHLYVFFGEMSFSHFLIGLFVFLVLSCMSYLCILEINPYQLFICYYFLPFWGLPFHLAYSFLCSAKAFQFSQVPNVYFYLYLHYSKRWATED